MNKLMKFSLVLLISILFLGSCSDGFLSPNPKSFFTPENTFNNPAGMEAAVQTMRVDITGEYLSAKSLIMHQWAASDVGVPLLQMDFRRLTPSTDKYDNFVGQINEIYRYVKNANTIISRIDEVEWEDQNKRNAILAEALWYRAYWYYRLVGNYGNVPWVGKEVKGAKIDFNTYTRSAILQKIQTDLEFTVQHLPVSAKPGAVTKGAGNHLLTKVYLANMEFDKAIKAATRVINGPYSLMTERFGVDANDTTKNVIWDLHRPANKNAPGNKETILAIVDRYEAPPNGARSVGLQTMRAYHSEWWHPNHRDSLGNTGMVLQGAQWDSLGEGNPECALTQWYQYDIWGEGNYEWNDTPDLRRADTNWKDIREIKYNNPNSVNYGDRWRLKWHTGDKYNVFWQMYALPIYKTSVPEQQEGARPFGGNGDWYIYRLAGTYLLRAEAYYWKGELGLAAQDINKIRSRAHAPLISPGDVTIDAIFNERARELFAESPRQNELVRASYMMAKQGLNGYSEDNLHENNWFYDRVMKYNSFYSQYTGDRQESYLGLQLPIGNKLTVIGQSPHMKPYHYLWPIDVNLINANTLGNINQNLGYDGAQNNEPPKENIEETNYN